MTLLLDYLVSDFQCYFNDFQLANTPTVDNVSYKGTQTIWINSIVNTFSLPNVKHAFLYKSIYVIVSCYTVNTIISYAIVIIFLKPLKIIVQTSRFVWSFCVHRGMPSIYMDNRRGKTLHLV